MLSQLIDDHQDREDQESQEIIKEWMKEKDELR